MIDEVSAMLDGRFMFMDRSEKAKKLQTVYEKLGSLCVEVLFLNYPAKSK